MDLNEKLREKAKKGDLQACADLIVAGADVNAKDSNGLTPLNQALHYGYFEVSKYLLEQGTKMNAVSALGWSHLHFSAAYGFIDLSELLLTYGADINANDVYGFTPLIGAIRGGHEEICVYLLDGGANTLGVNEALQTHPKCFAAVTAWLAKRCALEAASQAAIEKAPMPAKI